MDINRSKERFNKSKDDLSNILNRTAEISNPSDEKLICSTPLTNKKRLPSSKSILNKEACIKCQSRESTLHEVAFESTSEKTFDVAKKTYRSFIVFMLKHHSKCFRYYSK